MNPLTKQDVIEIIKEFNTTGGGTVGGFTVPRHQHNGSDMIKVIMADLAYDQRGLIFPMAQGQAQMVIINGNTLAISGNASDVFKQVRIVFDANYFTETEETATSTAVITTGPSWFLRLPNNSILPASPQVGDICIFNGILQVCEVTGVWTPK